jgi:hypothetical protein
VLDWLVNLAQIYERFLISKEKIKKMVKYFSPRTAFPLTYPVHL